VDANPGPPHLHLFIKEMNKYAQKLKLKKTNYTNPHGLANKANHSSAADVAQLSCYAMKNPIFAKIVDTKEHNTMTYMLKKEYTKLNMAANYMPEVFEHKDLPFKAIENSQFVEVPTVWYNSNKMLGLSGFHGVKTGVTSTAGSCLSVYYANSGSGKKLITVVLGCRNVDYRWKDTRRLTLWADSVL